MDNLKLTFPSPHPSTHLLVETRVDELSAWLEGLPSGNMPRYVKEVADAITNINRTELPIVQRLELIQLVDIAYEKIHNYYRPLMKDGPHKGKHAPHEELKEVYHLTQEMSFAYKIAVYALYDKTTIFGKNKHLANVINMALHYLSLVLLEHYELYAPIPMYIWREIHQLYFCAEQRELSELINPSTSLKNCFQVVEETYLRICLIAMSNPYHLKRGDHWEVFIYLSYWTTKSIISEDPDDYSDMNCFVINLDSDEKPLYYKDLSNKEYPQYRFILTNQLTLKICHTIDEIQGSNKNPRRCFSKNVVARKATLLLEDLLASWESKQDRQGPRYPKISRMEVIWGLSDIHKVLSGSDPLQANVSEQELAQNAKLIEHDWHTLNEGDGGICITLSKEKVREIDVGLLVAIRKTISDDRPAAWSLGMICWIIGNQRQGTQVGIQYLKGDIQAVFLQARKGNKIETRFQPALLLSGEKIQGLSTPTLLTAIGLYIESRPMMLRIGEEEQFIHARMKVNSSGTIDRFFYQLDTQVKAELKQTTKKGKKDDKSEDEGEVIDLSAMPTAHVEEFDEEVAAEKAKQVTLDDVIVSKNK